MHYQYALISRSHILVTIHPSQDIDMFDDDGGGGVSNNGMTTPNEEYNPSVEAALPAHNTPTTIDINPFLLDDHG